LNPGLEGRTALVLGASSGLGLASAEALREEGANVVMLARREELLRREAERLGATAVVGGPGRIATARTLVQVALPSAPRPEPHSACASPVKEDQ
jgi:3-oxoacyl-[acyl-carrier protein] reductase